MIYDEAALLFVDVLRNGATVIYARFVSAFSEPQSELQFGTHKSTAPPTAVFLCLKSVSKSVLNLSQIRRAALSAFVEAKKTALAEARTVPSISLYRPSR